MKLVFEKVIIIIIFVTSVHSKYIDEEMVQKSLITQFFEITFSNYVRLGNVWLCYVLLCLVMLR